MTIKRIIELFQRNDFEVNQRREKYGCTCRSQENIDFIEIMLVKLLL